MNPVTILLALEEQIQIAVAPWLIFPRVQLCSQAGVTPAVRLCLSVLLCVLPLVTQPRKTSPSEGGELEFPRWLTKRLMKCVAQPFHYNILCSFAFNNCIPHPRSLYSFQK